MNQLNYYSDVFDKRSCSIIQIAQSSNIFPTFAATKKNNTYEKIITVACACCKPF